MTDFLNTQTSDIAEFDDKLVRKLVEKATVYDAVSYTHLDVYKRQNVYSYRWGIKGYYCCSGYSKRK